MTVRSSTPTVWSALRFRGKVLALQSARAMREFRGGARRFGKAGPRNGELLLAESVSALRATDDRAGEPDRALTLGKVHNLRLAVKRIDGALVPANQTFSFWKQLGPATRRRGYVEGRELREGCIVPSIGGGLCQLSNALYDAALRAGFEIVERHAHTAVVPGSLAEIGRDATVFWNYVDLRFRVRSDLRVEAVVGTDSLSVRFWGAAADAASAPPDTSPAAPARPLPTGDCASCAADGCFRHVALHRHGTGIGRTAFLLDAFWPEYDAYIGSVAERRDTVFLPLDGARRGLRNYRWDTAVVGTVRESPLLTLLRSYRSRRLGRHGAARQRALLHWARRIGDDFAARLPYDVTHLVVMQHLLPALWSGGYLGGRTYDVLMTGPPMRALQRTLDDAYALHPESPTLNDFRADAHLVDAEERALAGARRIVTPHAAIAAQFASRALRLPWAYPPAAPVGTQSIRPQRPAVLFPASTLGRAGAYELRGVARELGLHVILTGPDLESVGFWSGLSVERLAFEDTLLAAPLVVLPAFVEHQPRRLLRAVAHQVPVIASEACGLGDLAGVTTVPAGDSRALADALRRALSGLAETKP